MLQVGDLEPSCSVEYEGPNPVSVGPQQLLVRPRDIERILLPAMLPM